MLLGCQVTSPPPPLCSKSFSRRNPSVWAVSLAQGCPEPPWHMSPQLCSAPGGLAGFKQFKPLTFHQDLSQLLKARHPLSLFNALCFSCSGSKEGL